MRNGLIKSVFVVLLACGSAPLCSAALIYDSNGFENPPFTTGTLVGQDGGTWLASSGTNNAIVQTNTVYQGGQAVQVTRTNTDKYYWPSTAIVTPSAATGSRFVLVNWDMNVTQSTSGASFGPFAGIMAFDPNTATIGGAGVDSTTGELLYSNPNDPQLRGALDPTPGNFKVSLGAWHHYTLAFDFQLHQTTVLVDGTAVLTTPGTTFVDETNQGDITQYSDADIATLAVQQEPPTESGVSNFDNYLVTTSNSIPEPATMAVVGIAGLALFGRPGRRSPLHA